MTSMSALASSTALPSSALGSPSSVPAVDEANLPAAIRNGTADQKKAYQTALSFEGVLVSQMTKAMMATTGMPGMNGAAASSSDTDASAQGDDAGTAMMKQTLPDTLASAIMNNGGLGLAQQLDTTFPTAAKSTSLAAGQGGVTA